MIPNGLDIVKSHLGSKEPVKAFKMDRRKCSRTRVHWPVRLMKDGSRPEIESLTQNLSASGFYCFSAVPLTPGETLTCTLDVPAHDPRNADRTLAIECRALVVRSEATPEGSFGIACHIEDYRLLDADLSD